MSSCFFSDGIIEGWKLFAQPIYYTVGTVAAIFALWTYRANSRRERAKWAVQLYDKFYESDHHKNVRDTLDSAPDTNDVQQLVKEESAAFTDYLNFFELVTCLAVSKQLSESDILNLFQYYLKCLKQHNAVMDYVNEPGKGFEGLGRYLKKMKF